MKTIFSFVFLFHFSFIGMLTTHRKLNQCGQFVRNTFNIGYRFGFHAHTHKKVNGRDVSSKEDAETLFSENKNAVTLLVSRSLYTVSSIICLRQKRREGKSWPFCGRHKFMCFGDWFFLCYRNQCWSNMQKNVTERKKRWMTKYSTMKILKSKIMARMSKEGWVIQNGYACQKSDKEPTKTDNLNLFPHMNGISNSY